MNSETAKIESGKGGGKSRAEVQWSIPLYTARARRMARDVKSFETLWQLYRLEKVLPESDRPEIIEKVEEGIEAVGLVLDEYERELSGARDGLLAVGDAKAIMAAADELPEKHSWVAKVRSPIGRRYLWALTVYAKLEALGEAAVAGGANAESVQVVLTGLRGKWIEVGKRIRAIVDGVAKSLGYDAKGEGEEVQRGV